MRGRLPASLGFDGLFSCFFAEEYCSHQLCSALRCAPCLTVICSSSDGYSTIDHRDKERKYKTSDSTGDASEKEPLKVRFPLLLNARQCLWKKPSLVCSAGTGQLLTRGLQRVFLVSLFFACPMLG